MGALELGPPPAKPPTATPVGTFAAFVTVKAMHRTHCWHHAIVLVSPDTLLCIVMLSRLKTLVLTFHIKQCQQTVFFLHFLFSVSTKVAAFFPIHYTSGISNTLQCNIIFIIKYIFNIVFYYVFRKFEICSPKLSSAMVDGIRYKVLRALQISFHNAYQNQTIQ